METKKVYGLIILGGISSCIPALLFESKENRIRYIDEVNPESYRVFEYEIEEELFDLDIAEGCPSLNN